MSAASAQSDSRRRPPGRRSLGFRTVVLASLFSLVAHAAAMLVARAALQVPKPAAELGPIRLVQPPPDLEPEPEPEPPTPPPPKVEEVSAPAPAPTPKPRPRPQRPSTPRPKPRPTPAPAPAPEPSPSQPARRDLSHLSLPRMQSGTGGWAVPYGTGPVRSGVVDPKASPAQVAPAPEPEGEPAPLNRAATRLPGAAAATLRPKRLSAPEPAYPPRLREQGIEGDVVVRVAIDTRGQVTRVDVVRPSPHIAFNTAAIASAKQTRYAPATRAGKPVAYTQRYTIRFRIRD